MSQINDVMKLCCELSTNQQIKSTVMGAKKGAAAGGWIMLVGELLGGPLGIAVGGVVGGLFGWWMTSGQFKPLPQVIMELTPHQQQRLYADVSAILGNQKWTYFAQLMALVMGNATLMQRVTAALLSFISKELQAKVYYVD
ncbi:hypothetical protein NHX12_002590 [Muraenolepis orangiensis]|uniref:Uncharacterized protein n=1 Tax=Muraenolepis orangiensis TaxID=630683 RepID=A0A9Q0DX64_9TELE|nr:hypothetical protein NHX12_002590 [Muraenolepis orangiensis]